MLGKGRKGVMRENNGGCVVEIGWWVRQLLQARA